MTTSVFHNNTFNNCSTCTQCYEDCFFYDEEMLFYVEVYGEAGEFEVFEVMAPTNEAARLKAETQAMEIMNDISFINISSIE